MKSLLVSLTLPALLFSQSPAFDVASLKPVQITSDNYDINLGGAHHGEVVLTNTTLSDCLRFAYGITNDTQIAAGDKSLDWIRSKEVRFDILGKASPDTPEAELRRMLQTLLLERFQMTVHHEPREIAYLALTVSRNGPKMNAATEARNTTGKPQLPGHIISTHLTMAGLTTLLSRFQRGTVIDQTNLAGAYNVSLVWTPESATGAEETPGPSIFTALQEQLGLKLEARKGPVDVLVVDQALKVPMAN